MAKFSVYLNFDGTTEEAFNMYRQVFGGEFVQVNRFKNGPGAEKLSAELGEKIMYIGLPVGGDMMLHGTDSLAEMGHPLTVGNNFSLMIDPSSKEEAEHIFQALAEGGQVTMPLQDTFWGAYYGQLTDRFGVQWMVNYVYPPTG